MKSVCIYFQVHQPFRLRTYRFFDIGSDHFYFDDYQNRHIIQRIAEKCYLPANALFLDLIKRHGKKIRLAFSISGSALDQLQLYAPQVIKSFQELAKTGCVEFLAETYAHSLSSLKNQAEFERQVKMHSEEIERLFGQKPKTFRNTELVYSDDIGKMVYDMGYQTILAEGAKHVLGWKSPNYVYNSALAPKLNVLLRNFRLSDDIAFRFSNSNWAEWPLDAPKFIHWLQRTDAQQKVINLFMDYETVGEHQWAETGIFEFIRGVFDLIIQQKDLELHTPSDVVRINQPTGSIYVPYPSSWADEERDLTAWLGNELQDEASLKLYQLAEYMNGIDDVDLQNDWLRLQTSDHFYYMCTKWFSDGEVHKYFNPYPSPYEAFINYMNVLADFELRCKALNGGHKEGGRQQKSDKKQITVKTKNQDEENLFLIEKVMKTISIAKLKKVINSIDQQSLLYSSFEMSTIHQDKILEALGKRKAAELKDQWKLIKPNKTKTKSSLKSLLKALSGK